MKLTPGPLSLGVTDKISQNMLPCLWYELLVFLFYQVPMPMVYNAEEIMGGDGDGMVAIGMVEEDENEGVQHHQVDVGLWYSLIRHRLDYF